MSSDKDFNGFSLLENGDVYIATLLLLPEELVLYAAAMSSPLLLSKFPTTRDLNITLVPGGIPVGGFREIGFEGSVRL